MRRVLITGGTGTFGGCAVRVLLRDPEIERVVVLSRDEQKQFVLQSSFQDAASTDRLACFLGDVRDRDRLRMAMHGVDTVIHAAALKIVPKGEIDPSEFVKTNIIGSDNVVHAALEAGVSKCVMLSTDKAVSPVNLYGATKLAAEKLFVAANAYRSRDSACFSVVRYGNVAGSRGSVLAFWRVIAARGGALPITDLGMTRFWITIPRAVEFVLQAIGVMGGGEIFIPRMPSFRVVDLAEAFAPGRSTEVIGIRAGEKLHEDLITVHEAASVSSLDHAYVICPPGRIPEVPASIMGLTSQNNREWLTVEMLRGRLADV